MSESCLKACKPLLAFITLICIMAELIGFFLFVMGWSAGEYVITFALLMLGVLAVLFCVAAFCVVLGRFFFWFERRFW